MMAMKSISKRTKQASYLSRRVAAARERLRVALSVDRERIFSPAEESLARSARAYMPHIVAVTQDLSTLKAQYGSNT